jgi:cysteine sulfinate desulfinase/cysteine desulfurase-like protein
MGQPTEIARGGVRVSLTPQARMGDVERFTEVWRAIHSRMGRSRAA